MEFQNVQSWDFLEAVLLRCEEEVCDLKGQWAPPIVRGGKRPLTTWGRGGKHLQESQGCNTRTEVHQGEMG